MKIEEFEGEEINDAYEMGELLSERFEDFISNLCKEEGITREPIGEELDNADLPQGYRIYTSKGSALVDAEQKRLHHIGQKYFPDEDTPVESSHYQEL